MWFRRFINAQNSFGAGIGLVIIGQKDILNIFHHSTLVYYNICLNFFHNIGQGFSTIELGPSHLWICTLSVPYCDSKQRLQCCSHKLMFKRLVKHDVVSASEPHLPCGLSRIATFPPQNLGCKDQVPLMSILIGHPAPGVFCKGDWPNQSFYFPLFPLVT